MEKTLKLFLTCKKGDVWKRSRLEAYLRKFDEALFRYFLLQSALVGAHLSRSFLSPLENDALPLLASKPPLLFGIVTKSEN